MLNFSLKISNLLICLFQYVNLPKYSTVWCWTKPKMKKIKIHLQTHERQKAINYDLRIGYPHSVKIFILPYILEYVRDLSMVFIKWMIHKTLLHSRPHTRTWLHCVFWSNYNSRISDFHEILFSVSNSFLTHIRIGSVLIPSLIMIFFGI